MISERFFGIGEPLIQREKDTGVKAAEYLELVNALGCRAFRSWMHITDVLLNPVTPEPKACEAHKALLKRAKELDIEITGMSHEWFLPEGCKQSKGHAMPPRDLTAGSLYMKTLEMLETSWETMAELFPEVSLWEIGNEWNLNAFLHPDGFLQTDIKKPFTADEKMDIAIDLMYFSAKGIRKGNPDAKVCSFSLALSTPWLGGDLPDYLPPMYGIAWTLDNMYKRIKSGKFWSDNPDDYFDLLSWHPYQMCTDQQKEGDVLFREIVEPDSLWKDYNEAAYRVMRKYGDGNKKVLLTEVGFTDFGNPGWEKERAGYTEKILKMAMEMPFVHTIHNFRLLNDYEMLKRNGIENNEIGGVAEVYFGFFEELDKDCAPRLKAKVLQKLTGSTENLESTGKKVAGTKALHETE